MKEKGEGEQRGKEILGERGRGGAALPGMIFVIAVVEAWIKDRCRSAR